VLSVAQTKDRVQGPCPGKQIDTNDNDKDTDTHIYTYSCTAIEGISFLNWVVSLSTAR